MKKLFVFILASTFLFSCENNDLKKQLNKQKKEIEELKKEITKVEDTSNLIDDINITKVFNSYNDGMNYAKQVKKPIVLEFTGYSVVNGRRMEDQVLSDSIIKKIMFNDFVFISLYVDDRKELPLEQQVEITFEMNDGSERKRKITTIGGKWASLQSTKFKTNFQPYYVILDYNENQLIEPANYNSHGSITTFKNWLNKGLNKFNNKGDIYKSINTNIKSKKNNHTLKSPAHTWYLNSEKIDEGIYELTITADIHKGWHLYSQYLKSDDGPLSTYITFETTNTFKLIGNTSEKGIITKYDPVWEMEIGYFENIAIFTQKFKQISSGNGAIKGNINFMIGNDREVLPPNDFSFEFDVLEKN